MATRNNNLGKGSLLWGQSFRPITFIPPTDANGVSTTTAGALLNAVVGDFIDMDGALANADTNDANAYMPVPMALYFNQTDASGTDLAMTYRVDGKDQFGQDTIEDVSLTSDGAAYTNHCFSFVRTITIVAAANNTTSDTIEIGTNGNLASAFPVPLPFYLKDVNHIYGLAAGQDRLTTAMLTMSKVYHTATIGDDAGASPSVNPAEVQAVNIILINGAQAVY